MPNREDCCAQFDEANLEEDPDFRMRIESETVRVYRHVRAVLTEEKRIYYALKNNKRLLFPCTCSSLCSYSILIKPVAEAFHKLYREYKDLHEHYTSLFRSHHYEFEDDTVIVYRNPVEAKDSESPPLPTSLTYPLETDDLEADIDRIPERRHYVIHEMIWEQSCEGYVESIRYNIIQVSRSKWSRLVDWLKCNIWGRRKCVCFYCNYRDILVDFRDALLRLHLEYIELYAQYLAMLKATYSSNASRVPFKDVALFEEDYLCIKGALESQNF